MRDIRKTIGLVFVFGFCAIAIFLALRKPLTDAGSTRQPADRADARQPTAVVVPSRSIGGSGRPSTKSGAVVIDPTSLGPMLTIDGHLAPSFAEKLGLGAPVVNAIDLLIAETYQGVSAYQSEEFEIVDDVDGSQTIIVPSSEENRGIQEYFGERLAELLPDPKYQLVKENMTTGMDSRTGNFGLNPMLLKVRSKGGVLNFHIRVLPIVTPSNDTTVDEIKDSQGFTLKSLYRSKSVFRPEEAIPDWLTHFYEFAEQAE